MRISDVERPEELAHALVEELESLPECDLSVCNIIRSRPTDIIKLAHEKIHAYPWREVPACWLAAYTEASLLRVLQLVEVNPGLPETVTEIVRVLDTALIMTRGWHREAMIWDIFKALEKIHQDRHRRKALLWRKPFDYLDTDTICLENELTEAFPKHSLPAPEIRYPIDRMCRPTQQQFAQRLDKPLIMTKTIEEWPARQANRWSNPEYLFSKTLGGRRLVPVELGRTYNDKDWGQNLMTFGEFMDKYMLTTEPNLKSTGYMAQHDLFAQIPSLYKDIATPEYCYTPVPPYRPYDVSDPLPSLLSAPEKNAWFGPAGTISPLHHDPYYNILAQVVGCKYIRLYAPSETPRLYPMGVAEDGTNRNNNSQIDVEEMMALFEVETNNDDDLVTRLYNVKLDNGSLKSCSLNDWRQDFKERFPDAFVPKGGRPGAMQEIPTAEFVECVLQPGECLYIPAGWWHYVRSLSPSFSVSFWWNADIESEDSDEADEAEGDEGNGSDEMEKMDEKE